MTTDTPFLAYLLAILFSFTAITGVYTHLSSLNVDAGLGTLSLALAYITSLFFAPLAPVVGYRFGCKILLIAAEIGYLLFVLGNAYTSYFTVLPAGILLGMSEAWAWTAMPIITTFFAKLRSRNDARNREKHTRYYTGYYYAVIQASCVVGNGISSLVLYIDHALAASQPSNDTYHNNATERADLRHCGANDCQIAQVTQANTKQYHPAFVATRYTMVGIYLLLLLCAITVHSVYLPNDIKWPVAFGEASAYKDSEGLCSAKELAALNEKEPTNDREGISDAEDGPVEISNSERKSLEANESKRIPLTAILLLTLKSTVSLAFTVKHMLVMLLPIYNGMTIGYVMAEMTRAYSSCILGVDKVGICVVLYGLFSGLSSVITGKVAGKIGRNFPFLVALGIDVSIYSFSLLWQTSYHDTWLVYVLFLSFGVSGAICQTLTIALYGEYFIGKQEIAYNLWNSMVNCGFLIQFSLSTVLCIYSKIYIQLAILCTGMLFYGISQLVYYPRKCCITSLSDKRIHFDDK